MKIPISAPAIDSQDVYAVNNCLKSGWVSSAGPAINKFAKNFSKFLNVRFALPVSTGTAALHLALLAFDVKPNDEVILPALTFVSPASMTSAIGAVPVFVDVEKDGFNIDPNKIEKKITKRTKAIIAVHLYGYPANLDRILKIAKKHNLKVIEDCAEALGAKYRKKMVGSFGDIACFSFYGNKFITTGEGGMLTTNNFRFLKKAQLFCDHGMTKKRRYYHRVIGFNHRMTAMQAALGISQLKKIAKFLKQRGEILNTYQQELKNISQIKWVKPLPKTSSVCWLATCLLPNKKLRNGLFDYLAKKEVESRKVFITLPGMPPYPTCEKFPCAHSASNRGLSLPTFAHIKQSQVKRVCREIKNYFKLSV